MGDPITAEDDACVENSTIPLRHDCVVAEGNAEGDLGPRHDVHEVVAAVDGAAGGNGAHCSDAADEAEDPHTAELLDEHIDDSEGNLVDQAAHDADDAGVEPFTARADIDHDRRAVGPHGARVAGDRGQVAHRRAAAGVEAQNPGPDRSQRSERLGIGMGPRAHAEVAGAASRTVVELGVGEEQDDRRGAVAETGVAARSRSAAELRGNPGTDTQSSRRLVERLDLALGAVGAAARAQGPYCCLSQPRLRCARLEEPERPVAAAAVATDREVVE